VRASENPQGVEPLEKLRLALLLLLGVELAGPDAYSAFPVWEGEPVPEDMVPDPEDADGFLAPRRLGFVYRSEETLKAGSPRTYRSPSGGPSPCHA
jgi:hypothetical protein